MQVELFSFVSLDVAWFSQEVKILLKLFDFPVHIAFRSKIDVETLSNIFEKIEHRCVAVRRDEEGQILVYACEVP